MESGPTAEHRLVLWVLAARGILEFDLTDVDTCTVGRSPAAEVCVDDPSVSRAHARLTRTSRGLRLEDLESKNGTFVNGTRLVDGPAGIDPGDSIRVGNVELEVKQVRSRRADVARALSSDDFESRVAEEGERCLRFDRALAVVAVELSSSAESVIGRARQALLESLRSHDALTERAPGRLDLLLTECGAAEALTAGQRLSAVLASREIGAKVGVACFPGDAPSTESLVRAAQLAMQGAAPSGLACARQAARSLRIGAREVILAEPSMLRLYGLVERVAAADIPVLVAGETGSGKEIVGEALHVLGPRRGRPLVKINCSALPETLLESELFGYERGAFSGAVGAKPGLVEQAEGGTLFLDEISEMSPSLQAKLLRVLEDRRVRRLGAVADREVSVRFVAATHRDLKQATASGLFREDLYFRLDAMTLKVPPLRERTREIVPLAELFVAEAVREAGRSPCTLSGAAEGALLAYGWPGNVRELRNAMSRAVIVCDGSEVTLDHLPPPISHARAAAATSPHRSAESRMPTQELDLPLEEELRALERKRIMEALEACGGNQTRAAERLRMPRRTLVSKLSSLGLAGKRTRRR